MQAANPFAISAELPACYCSVDMSPHARQRTVERASIAPSRVLELVSMRRAVTLPFRASNRSYHLIFDRDKMDFVVAIVAIDRTVTGRSASVVTVLTREQFEADAGPIGKVRLRTAANRALDPVAFRHWEKEEFGERGTRRRFRVLTYYRREDGEIDCLVFANAPVCETFVDEHGLTNAAAHPGFWDWYNRQASRVGLPVATVVALRIADTDKVHLDISARALDCPCCIARISPPAKPVV